MRANRILVLIVAMLLPLSSCNWKSDGLERLNELYPPPVGPDAGTPGPICTLPDDPSAAAVADTATCTGVTAGHWAARVVQFGSMSPIGTPWNVTLADLFIGQLSADGKSMELTFCNEISNLTKPDGTPLSTGVTNVPDATRQAIGQQTLVLPLPSDGSFGVPDLAWLWGVHLDMIANPLTDDLPTDPTDPKVWDEDGDGNPGVTVDVQNPDGERYMARRARWTMHSTQPSSDGNWIVGPLDFAITEHALAASTPLLMTVAPISNRPECTSEFQIRCVDASYTCAQLVNDYTAIFRDAPKP